MINDEDIINHKYAIYKRVERFVEKKYKCEICDKKIQLNAHHEDYTQPENVIFLCRKCHSNRHNMKKEFLENEKTKKVFATHGFDIVSIVKREIETDAKKYKLYYRRYFVKEYTKSQYRKDNNIYNTQYSKLKNKGLKAVTVYIKNDDIPKILQKTDENRISLAILEIIKKTINS